MILLLGYKILSIDFKGAYLNAQLTITIYLEYPKNIDIIEPIDTKTNVRKLLKSIYGLKESGRLWYQTLKKQLLKMGFKVNRFDPCIFQHELKKIYILLYVDDCLVASENIKCIKEFVKELNNYFEVKITSLADFLGFSIVQNEKFIEISAQNYIKKTLVEIGLTQCKPVSTPVSTSIKFKDSDEISNEP